MILLTSGSLALIAFACMLVAAGLWREVTAKFLEENGENSQMRVETFLLDIVWDFWRALSFKLGGQKKLPIGIYFHGVLVSVAYGLFIVSLLHGYSYQAQ